MQNSCLLTENRTLSQLFRLSALHCCNMLLNSLVNCMGICTEDKQLKKKLKKTPILGCHLNVGSALSDINFKYLFLKFGVFSILGFCSYIIGSIPLTWIVSNSYLIYSWHVFLAVEVKSLVHYSCEAMIQIVKRVRIVKKILSILKK